MDLFITPAGYNSQSILGLVATHCCLESGILAFPDEFEQLANGCAFGGRKAPEAWRTPRRYRDSEPCCEFREVLDCGSPLPLWSGLTEKESVVSSSNTRSMLRRRLQRQRTCHVVKVKTDHRLGRERAELTT